MTEQISISVVGANQQTQQLLNILQKGQANVNLVATSGNQQGSTSASSARSTGGVAFSSNGPLQGGSAGSAVTIATNQAPAPPSGPTRSGGESELFGKFFKQLSAERIIEKAFEGVSEAGKEVVAIFGEVVHAGKEFQESLLAVAASLSQTTNVIDTRTGQKANLSDTVRFNEQAAKQFQIAGRSRLAPLGITGAPEAALISSVQAGFSARGIQLTPETVAKVAARLGAVAKVVNPALLDNIPNIRRDVEDVSANNPRAASTSLGSAIRGTGVFQALRAAKSDEEVSRAADLLKGYEEALKNSNLAIQSETRIRGTLIAAESEVGSRFLDELSPGLKKFAQDLEASSASLTKSFGDLAAEVGKVAGGVFEELGKLLKSVSPQVRQGVEATRGTIEGFRTGKVDSSFIPALGSALAGNKLFQIAAGPHGSKLPLIFSALGIDSNLGSAALAGQGVEDIQAEIAKAAEAKKASTLKSQGSPQAVLGNIFTQSGVAIEDQSKLSEARERLLPGEKISRLEEAFSNPILAGTRELRDKTGVIREAQANARQEQFDQFRKGTSFGSGANVAAQEANVGFQQGERGQLLNRLVEAQKNLAAEEKESGNESERYLTLKRETLKIEQELQENTAETVRALDGQVSAQEQLIGLKKSAVGGVGAGRDIQRNRIEAFGLNDEVNSRIGQIGILSQDRLSATGERRAVIEQELQVRELELEALLVRKDDLNREEQILQLRKQIETVDTESLGGQRLVAKNQVEERIISQNLDQRAPQLAQTLRDRAATDSQIRELSATADIQRASEQYANTLASLKDKSADLADSLIKGKQAMEDFSRVTELNVAAANDKVRAAGSDLEAAGGIAFGSPLFDKSDFEKRREAQLKLDQAKAERDRIADPFQQNRDSDRLGRNQAATQRAIDNIPGEIRDVNLAYLKSLQEAKTQFSDTSGALTNFSKSVTDVTEQIKALAGVLKGDSRIPLKPDSLDTKPTVAGTKLPPGTKAGAKEAIANPQGQAVGSFDSSTGTALLNALAGIPQAVAQGTRDGFNSVTGTA